MKTTGNRQVRLNRRTDVGAVLVVVLIVMIGLLGLGMSGLFLTGGNVQINTNINLRNQALVVAEAGIERARSLLNNPGVLPAVPALLAGSGNTSDEIPDGPSRCSGQARGAIMIDKISLGCETAPHCILTNIDYPTLTSDKNRVNDLPPAAGALAGTIMGKYTVYIRQDVADCRMGNYKCDEAPVPVGTPAGPPVCVDENGSPIGINRAVVVRSEGVASDGRTKVALEVTMTPALGMQTATAVPMGAMGAPGDPPGFNPGIVVNSTAPQNPPSQGTGGAGSGGMGSGGTGSGGTGSGGSSGSGGIPGSGGTSSPPGSGVGGSGTGGSGTGGSGTGGSGTGGSGTGGSGTGGSTGPCLPYAVQAVRPCPGSSPTGCIQIESGSSVNSAVAMTCASRAADPCSLNCSGCVTSISWGVSSSYNANTFPTPSCGTYRGGVTVWPNATISPGCYDTLNVNPSGSNHGTLTLTAGDYVVKYLNLNDTSPSGKLYIDDTNGPVRLWVPASGSVAMNSTVEVKSGNPARFWLIYNGTYDLANNTSNNFTGVIFAPVAKVNINYKVTGAVIGGMVQLNSPAVIRFDDRLKCP